MWVGIQEELVTIAAVQAAAKQRRGTNGETYLLSSSEVSEKQLQRVNVGVGVSPTLVGNQTQSVKCALE